MSLREKYLHLLYLEVLYNKSLKKKIDIITSAGEYFENWTIINDGKLWKTAQHGFSRNWRDGRKLFHEQLKSWINEQGYTTNEKLPSLRWQGRFIGNDETTHHCLVNWELKCHYVSKILRDYTIRVKKPTKIAQHWLVNNLRAEQSLQCYK